MKINWKFNETEFDFKMLFKFILISEVKNLAVEENVSECP